MLLFRQQFVLKGAEVSRGQVVFTAVYDANDDGEGEYLQFYSIACVHSHRVCAAQGGALGQRGVVQ